MNVDNKNSIIIPIFPLELTLLPGEAQVLRIFEVRYKQMLDDCLLDERPFGICLIDPFHPIAGWAGPHLVGTSARITEHEEVGSNHMVEIQGQRRFRIIDLLEPALPPMDPVQHRVFPDLDSLLSMAEGEGADKLYIRAEVEFLPEPTGSISPGQEQKIEHRWMEFLDALATRNGMPEEMVEEWKGAQLATVCDWGSSALWRIISILVAEANDKQSLLESTNMAELASELLFIID